MPLTRLKTYGFRPATAWKSCLAIEKVGTVFGSTISGVCVFFDWRDGDAFQVEVVDYH
jgi:hypothetical protein